MPSRNNFRLPALLGLCLTAALVTACASDSSWGRRSAMGNSGTNAMGASSAAGNQMPMVPSPTGATGPMDTTPNATGGTPSGTEGAGGR